MQTPTSQAEVTASSSSSFWSPPSWLKRYRWRKSSREEALIAEKNLLSLFSGSLESHDVKIGPGKHDFIHYVKGGTSNVTSPHLVALAGYGGGAGFKFRILDGLAAGFRLWAVDLLGTGLSGRPKFTARDTASAEEFFVDSLDLWREKAGVEKMVLLGHSMGGYLAASYALKFPERVQHLVLVCPAGIGKRPDDWQPPGAMKSPWTLQGQLYRLARSLWESGLTPGMVVRAFGPWGPRMVDGYVQKRFQNGHGLNEIEMEYFAKYCYAILAERGSGEHALRHILEPFAFPRSALEFRLDKLPVPITFIYGDKDWMDPRAAHRVTSTLKSVRGHIDGIESDLKVLMTPNAGHYNFMDQPGVFLEQILESVGQYLSVSQRQAVVKAAAKWPFRPSPAADTAAELKEEMDRNPAAAEAHVATDM